MPSEAVLVKGLRQTIAATWSGPDRDSITVNSMRTEAERAWDLEPGFFSVGDWKSRSKEIIKDECDRLTELDNPASSAPSPLPKPKGKKIVSRRSNGHAEASEQGKKRVAATKVKSPPKKRQKKQEAPSDNDAASSAVETFLDRSVSDASSDSFVESETNVLKRKNDGKTTNKSRARKERGSDEVVSPDSEQEEPDKSQRDVSSTSMSKPRASSRGLKFKTDSSADNQIRTIDKTTIASTTAPPDVNIEASDSDTSLLSDAPPQPKRQKSKSTKPIKPTSKPTTFTSAKPRPNAKSTTNTTLTPLEQDLKTLQAQLKKCGLNKIWAFELKHFGDDTAGKVRHLRALLREIGIEGRFSEAKAKEIKERRELMADVDALQKSARDGAEDLDAPRQRRSRGAVVGRVGEGNGKTKMRSRRGHESESEDDEDREGGEPGGEGEGEGEEDDGDEYVAPVKAMAARAKQDLAFLGDDDIDSDD